MKIGIFGSGFYFIVLTSITKKASTIYVLIKIDILFARIFILENKISVFLYIVTTYIVQVKYCIF